MRSITIDTKIAKTDRGQTRRELLLPAMRFRFCGGLEPPDWLLAEVPLLARVPVDAAAGLCAGVSTDLSASDGAVDHAAALFPAADGSDRSTEAVAVVTALRFVLTSAAKYDARPDDLRLELQQLGLDKPLAATVASAYASARVAIREQQRDQALTFARPEKMAWAVRRPPEAPETQVELRLQLSEPATVISGPLATSSASDMEAFVVSENKFLVLEEDLRRALATMQSVRL